MASVYSVTEPLKRRSPACARLRLVLSRWIFYIDAILLAFILTNAEFKIGNPLKPEAFA